MANRYIVLYVCKNNVIANAVCTGIVSMLIIMRGSKIFCQRGQTWTPIFSFFVCLCFVLFLFFT